MPSEVPESGEGPHSGDRPSDAGPNESRTIDGHGAPGTPWPSPSVGLSPESGEWRGLHPLSLLLVVLVAARQFAIPAILLLVFSVGSRGQLLFAFFLVFPIVSGFLSHFFFRYRLDADEVVVRQGVLHRSVRHVPYVRVQNLDTSEGLLQRMLGLVQVSLETASGPEPEARFRWVSRAEAESIRKRMLAARVDGRGKRAVAMPGEDMPGVAEEVVAGRAQGVEPGSAAGIEPDHADATAARAANLDFDRADGVPRSTPFAERRRLHRVPFRDLVILGLFSGRGLVIIGALAGLVWELRQLDVIDSPADFAKHEAPRVQGYLSELHGGDAVILFLVVLLILGIIVTLGSISLTVSAYYGFTLTAGGRDLYTQSGLLTRRTSTIGRRRIQILQVSYPPHLRWFGRTRLRAGTAGGRTGEASGEAWLVPILPVKRLTSLVREVQAAMSLDDLAWQPPHPRAAVRQQRRALWLVGAIALVGVLTMKGWGLSLLVLAPLAWIHAGRSVRLHGHAVTEHAVYARHGWLWRKLEIVPYNKIQAVSIAESPFDRRWGMATLYVDTAAASGSLAIPYLPGEEAIRLQRELTEHAGRRGFRW